MKASELRIGNWIESTNTVFGVTKARHWQVTVDDLQYIESSPIDYSPIPLTEEWLLKFGFEPNPYFFDKDGFNFYFNDGANGNWYPLVGSSVQVEYVHQLQNLYFALTGKELEIKL